MLRVPFDDLSLGEDQLMFLGEQPFTGVAYEDSPAGQTIGETEYANGLPQGLSRTWDEAGQLIEEAGHWGGARHGRARSWDLQGVLRSEETFEFGIRVGER